MPQEITKKPHFLITENRLSRSVCDFQDDVTKDTVANILRTFSDPHLSFEPLAAKHPAWSHIETAFHVHGGGFDLEVVEEELK